MASKNLFTISLPIAGEIRQEKKGDLTWPQLLSIGGLKNKKRAPRPLQWVRLIRVQAILI
jgi:hypothetical protein